MIPSRNQGRTYIQPRTFKAANKVGKNSGNYKQTIVEIHKTRLTNPNAKEAWRAKLTRRPRTSPTGKNAGPDTGRHREEERKNRIERDPKKRNEKRNPLTSSPRRPQPSKEDPTEPRADPGNQDRRKPRSRTTSVKTPSHEEIGEKKRLEKADGTPKSQEPSTTREPARSTKEREETKSAYLGSSEKTSHKKTKARRRRLDSRRESKSKWKKEKKVMKIKIIRK